MKGETCFEDLITEEVARTRENTMKKEAKTRWTSLISRKQTQKIDTSSQTLDMQKSPNSPNSQTNWFKLGD
ncbi:hypothetical protein GOBAR_DD17715 [Gossypium barbadense]|nr:hypothetical protein GOBAR_DD17715 [Gossypium barbadense]